MHKQSASSLLVYHSNAPVIPLLHTPNNHKRSLKMRLSHLPFLLLPLIAAIEWRPNAYGKAIKDYASLLGHKSPHGKLKHIKSQTTTMAASTTAITTSASRTFHQHLTTSGQQRERRVVHSETSIKPESSKAPEPSHAPKLSRRPGPKKSEIHAIIIIVMVTFCILVLLCTMCLWPMRRALWD